MATSQAGLDPTKTGKRGRKLSPKAQQLMVERIVAGDDNQRILARLKVARLLDEDDGLSERTFAYYRRLPLCQVQRECLSQAAREAAYAELSESVLNLIGQARHSRQKIADHAPQLSAQEISALAHIQFRSLRLVYHCFGLAGATSLCDAHSPEPGTGTAAEAMKKWKRAERDGRKAMAQVGL